MLYIRIEMWPRGNKAASRVLGEAEIANVGGTQEVGDYVVRLIKWGSKQTWRTGEVKNFPRRHLGPWDLLFRSLGSVIQDRNKAVHWPGDERIGGPVAAGSTEIDLMTRDELMTEVRRLRALE